MRKVANKTNHYFLKKLSDELIFPLVSVLVSAKASACSIRVCPAYISLGPLQKTVLDVALSQVVDKKAKTLEAGCDAVLTALTLTEINNLKNTFLSQSAALDSGNYAIAQVKFDKSVKKLFSDYLYSKLFDNENIWRALGLTQLLRRTFHDNFRKENNHPSTCPYCDLDTINSAGNVIIEHILPKSKFPLLSLHPMNLLSACNGCNTPLAKGSKVQPNISSPYKEEIGNAVKFDVQPAMKNLTISSAPPRTDIDGFLTLVNLKQRYADENTYIQFSRRTEAFVESMTNIGSLNFQDLLSYVAKLQGGAPLTYALKYWVEHTYIPGKKGGV
ncbi:HNH endonuclease [Burkholderia cepacia]|uniref:HNH endonuclease n=1 Tax=Burkholderia cepacia TaxID=292 RepID=UPI002AB6FDC8|nr:hypothetical protein [Burkholderia cepacia]